MPRAAQIPPHRKATGAYYTPAPLIDLLLDHALPPLLAARNPKPLRVLDPACGPGDFLRAARRRLPATPHLFGVDIDPAAAAHCRAALSSDSINPDHLHVQTADALLDPPPFLAPQSFDLILGNPPYVNAIEGNLNQETKARLRARFPLTRGTADLAHYFLEQAVGLVRPGGRIAFVLPRGVLNAPAVRALRAGLPPHLRPNLIYAPDRADLFPGAAVFVCLLVLGPGPLCQISAGPDPATARFETVQVTGDNWWLALHPPDAATPAASAPTLSSRFDVAASMIAADAYDLRPLLVDDAHAPGLKLVTTGLIEPRACLWGHRRCRYLKRDYAHPRLPASAPGLTRSLAARAASAARPKILVAGLARTIEAFLDAEGQYIGAVSTYSIYHPQNDLAALADLLDRLLSPATTDHFIRHLGANGMRGRHITVKKSFLRELPLSC